MTIAVFGVVTVLAITSIVWSMIGGGVTPAAPKAYFTTDDGRTLFVGDSEKDLPPFQHDGATASRAAVFSCDGGKTHFVGYLWRYDDPTRNKLANFPDQVPGAGTNSRMIRAMASVGGMEVKLPGAGNPWLTSKDGARFTEGQQIKCPDGNAAHQPVQVGP